MELILYICKKSLVLDSCNKYCRSRPLTKRSLLSACIYLSIKSNIVSHKAVKVLRDNNGLKCWRKTWNEPPKLNLLFNLTTVTSIAFVTSTHFLVHLNKFYACKLKKNPTYCHLHLHITGFFSGLLHFAISSQLYKNLFLYSHRFRYFKKEIHQK